MAAGVGGLAQGLQVFTAFGLLYYALRFAKKRIVNALFLNVPISTMTLYMILAAVSALWSYVPAMSLFMAVEKLIFIIVLYAVVSEFRSFYYAEAFFVLLMVGILVFNGVATRLMGYQTLIGHDLQQGSCAAMCFSYCVGEIMAGKLKNKERYQMLWAAILISVLFLGLSTSGGANASAAFGFGIALFASGKKGYAFFLLLIGASFYVYEDLFENMFELLMQGKSKGDISSATGRTAIWEVVEILGAQKPMLGWGYAAMERYITDKGPMPLTDLHSNYYGTFGGLGIVGLVLLMVHHISSIVYLWIRHSKPGYVGLLSAICCAALNGYSYGFIAGKTAIITVVYLAVLMMTYIYSKVRV